MKRLKNVTLKGCLNDGYDTMINSRMLLYIILISFVAHNVCGAYELATHGRVTFEAYKRSVVSDEVLIGQLGIRNGANVFGISYYDVFVGTVQERERQPFEEDQSKQRMPVGTEPLSIEGWLMRGAIREDDHPTTDIAGCYKKSEHPQDDPYNEPDLTRPLNHFFDPVNDRPLSKLAGWVALGERAPHWALGSTDPFAAPNTANAQRKNHFTVFDAREAMYRALTGMNKAGSKAIGTGGVEPSSAEEKETVRKAYWATTFRALGDVVHLIQDMAQPQHTRNDAHSGVCGSVAQEVFTGHESVYERRVDARALDNSLDKYYAGYPKVVLNDYTSYFSTRHLHPVNARQGIADYSNREFLSVGTNIGSYRYSSPSNNRDDYQPELISDHKGVVTSYLKRTVADNQRPEIATGVKMAQESLFKAFLDPGDNFPVDPYEYAMNNDIYDAHANLLIPRAVAYSAGLIDYFFRGRMEISLPDDGVYAILDHAVEKATNQGFRKVKLKLRNITPAINDNQNSYPQAMGGGTLRAVAKFRRNDCYQPDLSGEAGVVTGCNLDANRGAEDVAVSAPIAIQSLSTTQPQPFSFDFSADPIPVNAMNVHLQVVYRGNLGSEADAVVVATKDISEPTFVSIANYTDYFLLDGVFYRPEEILNTQALFQRIDRDFDGQYDPQKDVNIDPVTLIYRFNAGGPALGYVELPPERYCRFAILTENPNYRMNIYKQSFGYWISPVKPTNVSQLNPVSGGYELAGYSSTRGFKMFHNWPDWKYLDYPPSAYTTSLDALSNTNPFSIDISF